MLSRAASYLVLCMRLLAEAEVTSTDQSIFEICNTTGVAVKRFFGLFVTF